MSVTPEFDVVCVGELNADAIVRGAWPRRGKEVIAHTGRLVLGSSTAIFASDIARLGLRVAFCGLVGGDALGRFVLDELRAAGVSLTGVQRRDSLETGLTVSLTDSDDRALVTVQGSMAHFGVTDLDWDVIGSARHLHVASPFLQPQLLPDLPDVLECARNRGLSISLDPGWDPREEWDGVLPCMEFLDLFLPNGDEAMALTGEADVVRAASELAHRVPVVAVKLGVLGGLVADPNGVYRCRAIPVEVVDTTGAGDGFDAGFVWAWLHGERPADCLRTGCVAGGLSTRALGGAAAFPAREELEELR